MAVNIRFDYYNLDIDICRKRSSEQGQQFFGRVDLSDFCIWINNYFKSNKFGKHGESLINYANDKKWVKWVSSELNKGQLKLLFTFSDKEVDPRLLTDRQDNVLSQPIPSVEYGQRTLLHMVISPKHGKICIQNVVGFTKEYLHRLLSMLLSKVAPSETWQARDPVSEEDIECRGQLVLSVATTDKVLDIIHNGGLRGLMISEKYYGTDRFDSAHHLKQTTTNIMIRADGSQFTKITLGGIADWVNKVVRKKSHLKDPSLALVIQDPDTGSEVKYEILNGVIDGFAQKAFLNWGDRTKKTHEAIAKEIPTPILQFYDTMIKGF